ncbi:MAG: TetR/AcrR family transcriptional regulator C-terminal domain-containing protein [Solirubrobacterales bacterium]
MSGPATRGGGAPHQSRAQPLSRELIAATALALADRDGPEALSMRRLASELGVGAMSLYRYFRNKQELLDAVVDAAAAETPAEVDVAGPWKEELRRLMRGVRASLARHPIGIWLRLRGPLLSPGALRVTEAGMQILERAGFDRPTAAHAYRALFLYTFGFAAFNSPDAPEEARRQARAALMALGPDQYPALTSAAEEAAATMAGDDQYEFGLGRLLDGLQALAPGDGAHRARSCRDTVGAMVTDEDVERAARALADAAASPAKVILFGSRARADADPRSDLDFLVVEDEVQDTIREAARLRRALPPLGVPVDVLAISAAEAERRREWPGSVVRAALREGRVLVEP